MSILSFAGLWEGRNRTRVLLLSIVILFAIAIVDWRTKPYVSLGFLYLFPIMLTARFLPRWAVVLLALLCAALSELFSSLDPSDALIRLSFETLALAGCGLFMAELLRNRQLTQEAEERLRVLVKTSPAAIVTVDERGFIERANHAAAEPPRRWHGHYRIFQYRILRRSESQRAMAAGTSAESRIWASSE